MKNTDTKHCPQCGGAKPVIEFHKDKNTKDGLSPYCKACKKVQNKTYKTSKKGKTAIANTVYGIDDSRDFKKYCCYRIQNDETREEYFGVTCKSLHVRLSEHISAAFTRSKPAPIHIAMRKSGSKEAARAAWSIEELWIGSDKATAELVESIYISSCVHHIGDLCLNTLKRRAVKFPA